MKGEKKPAGQYKRGRKVRPVVVRREVYRTRIVELYKQGNSMARVTELATQEFNHSFGLSTIHKYIHDAIKDWQKERLQMMSDHKAVELARINKLEAEAWDSFYMSREDQLTETEKSVPQPGKKAKLITELNTTRKKSPPGDVRFLNTIQWCIEQRCKILGFEPPLKQDKPSDTPAVQNVTVLKQVVFSVLQTTEG